MGTLGAQVVLVLLQITLAVLTLLDRRRLRRERQRPATHALEPVLRDMTKAIELLRGR